MENAQNRTENLQKLKDKIKDVKIAMLTTVDDDGCMHSRPMRTQEMDAEGNVWFFTGYDSAKSHEIKQDAHVNISYAQPSDEVYVSVSGKASLTRDKAKIDELWSPDLNAWFPNGKEDPNVGLLKIFIDKAEYWDTPNSGIVHLIGMAKATLTGETYKPGDHDKIDL